MTAVNPVKTRLNTIKPETLPDHLTRLHFGSMLRGQIPQVLRNGVPAADNGASASTMQSLVLPNDAKASVITRAYARTGTAGTGEMTAATAGATPTSGQIVVQPNGDLGFLAADAILNVDVEYTPARGSVLVLTGLPVVSNVITIPAVLVTRGVILLIDLNATTATTTGRKRVLAPASSTPATGFCKLNVAKSTITVAAGDAITVADVTLLVASDHDLGTYLESESVML